jgi:ankyrin repeat protein
MFRALTQNTSDAQKRVMVLFKDAVDDFRYDFDLSPILCALLDQYDSSDTEKPSLQTIINFALQAVAKPLDHDWTSHRKVFRGRSSLFCDIISLFKQAEPTEGGRIGAFWNLINGTDALQCWTPLQWAAYTDRKTGFVTLLEKGAHVLGFTPSRRNILHQAAESGTQGVLSYLLENHYHKKGVDINMQDIWNETPLHIACGWSSASVSLLLQHGANAKLRQYSGQVPLHYTKFLSGTERFRCLKALLQTEDPPVNLRDDEGKSPIFYLLDSPECIQLLLNSGADIGVLDIHGKSVLHHACTEDQPETLELLLSQVPRDATPITDQDGYSPLHTCFLNHKLHHRVRCALLLLKNTAIIPVTDKRGWNLVHHAVKMGNEEVLKRVLSLSGVESILAKTHDGNSVVDICRRMGSLNGIIGETLRQKLNLTQQEWNNLDRRKEISWELLNAIR